MPKTWSHIDGERFRRVAELLGYIDAESIASKLAELTATRVKGRTVERWIAGNSAPAHKYSRWMRDRMGFPVRILNGGAKALDDPLPPMAGLTGVSRETAPAGPPELNDKRRALQQLMADGAAAEEQYNALKQLLAASLGTGLGSDESRAYQQLRMTLKEEIAAAREQPPLHEHPDWPAALGFILDAIAAHPAAAADVRAALGIAVPERGGLAA